MDISVVVEDSGPLYVRLVLDGKGGVLRVNGWDRTPHGGPGPIEITNAVRPGDALIAVNGTSLTDVGVKTSVQIVKLAAVPRTFTFYRPKLPLESSIKPKLPLLSVLSADTINESQLRKLAQCLSDYPLARPLVWRLVLGYLPKNRGQWLSHTNRQRGLYRQFLHEFAVGQSFEQVKTNFAQACNGSKIASSSNRTSPTVHLSSMWSLQRQDSELKRDIHTDVTRSHQGFLFVEGSGPARRQAIERILFIYAKLNPGVGYVQGMNDVLDIIFYVLASDSHEEWGNGAEPDSFFCFTNIMAEMRDVYIQSLDYSESGLSGKMSQINALLCQHDPELWRHLTKNKLDPTFYSLRWITTFFAREFALPDTLRLWDCILSEIARFDFMCYFSLSMIMAKRETLLQGDFSSCLHILQHDPPTDLISLLQQTDMLRRAAAFNME